MSAKTIACFAVTALALAAEAAPFRDSVAFDTALSWISRPGRFSCPASYGSDSYRYVADQIATTGVRHVRESLSRARLVTYEVKSAQDKVENDYASARMWFKGKKRSPMQFRNPVPVGTWETRWQEVGAVVRESDATRMEFGGHPKGHDVTYWIRNVKIYTEKSGAR